MPSAKQRPEVKIPQAFVCVGMVEVCGVALHAAALEGAHGASLTTATAWAGRARHEGGSNDGKGQKGEEKLGFHGCGRGMPKALVV